MQTRTRISTLLLVLLLLGATSTAFAEITLTTDKPIYTLGEIVHITTHNAGPTAEEFLSYPYFSIFNEDTNECIMGCAGLPVITPFAVGETVSTDWDTGFFPDVPGNYCVGVAVANGPTTSYVLTDGVSAEPNSWGTLKALYR
jgi:hypothetical protein